MSSPPSALLRHNLSIADALARSGIKGGIVPGFDASVQPVVVMANMSQTYSGEPLEARGLAGQIGTVIPLNERAYVRVQALAPGGIVVEYLSAATRNALSTACFVDVLEVPPTPSAFENPCTVVQCGGALALSTVFEGSTLDPPSGAGELELSPALGNEPVLRVYVPSGSNLVLFSGVQSLGGLEIEFRTFWREIPAPIGLP